MYDQSIRTRSGYSQMRSQSKHQTNGGGQTQRREQILITQLVVCVILFLTVFVGKGIFPSRLVQMRDEIQMMISTDFDFQGALKNLGESLAESNTVLSDLGDFCVQVFGTSHQDSDEYLSNVEVQPVQPAALLMSELQFLSDKPDALARTEHYASVSKLGVHLTNTVEIQEENMDKAEDEQAPAVLPAGSVVEISNYDGPALPNNYTMDRLSLGELQTMTPLMGHMNSGYGYRIHPVNGKVGDFHGGVDIGGQMGDQIAAFASGTVEYTGRDDSYGLYLQVDHGNGVKSFYAHCSQVNVAKGQKVSMGDTVALVGSTGTATGPHLHLELKYGKMHLNPTYYVDFLEPG